MMMQLSITMSRAYVQSLSGVFTCLSLSCEACILHGEWTCKGSHWWRYFNSWQYISISLQALSKAVVCSSMAMLCSGDTIVRRCCQQINKMWTALKQALQDLYWCCRNGVDNVHKTRPARVIMLAHKYSALVGRVENCCLGFFCCCRVAGFLTSQSLQSTCNYFCTAIAQLTEFTASEWSTRDWHPVGQPKKANHCTT